ncbi:MAG: hypothetical protein ACHQNT_07150 [Bacteroidia bacterium]
MKRLLLIPAMLLISFTGFTQSKLDKWPELKTFHGVMSQTFHPSEEGNLQPIKERAGEMLEKAQALASSKIPPEFTTDVIISATRRLVAGSVDLKTSIDNKESDEVITKKLSALHDVFHEIVEKCMHPEGEKHEHQE